MAVIQTEAPENLKPQPLTFDSSAISAWIFMQQKPAAALQKDLSNVI